ncbi:hypothetical protein [Acinetobacter boissieri]|uniref:hypothetical protein n=1 Tax=Acinetobacter boissieri TaxID=1219383 RepID=UPI001178309A|nr:hypothetical protein [Acinetobacter boissieri]
MPKTDLQIQREIDEQLMKEAWKLEKQFDTIPSKDYWRLPEFDSREYALIKRNNIMLFVPRHYSGYHGFNIAWPSDTNRLLHKQWKSRLKEEVYFRIFMYSPQYFEQAKNGEISSFSNTPCENKESYNQFKWKGILIQIYAPLSITNVEKTLSLDEQKPDFDKDICLTALKILNDEIKEVHYVR